MHKYHGSQVLLQQQQSQIDDEILKAQHDALVNLADDNNIRLAEFDAILQPIIESCTKDSISAGKLWFYSEFLFIKFEVIYFICLSKSVVLINF